MVKKTYPKNYELLVFDISQNNRVFSEPFIFKTKLECCINYCLKISCFFNQVFFAIK